MLTDPVPSEEGCAIGAAVEVSAGAAQVVAADIGTAFLGSDGRTRGAIHDRAVLDELRDGRHWNREGDECESGHVELGEVSKRSSGTAACADQHRLCSSDPRPVEGRSDTVYVGIAPRQAVRPGRDAIDGTDLPRAGLDPVGLRDLAVRPEVGQQRELVAFPGGPDLVRVDVVARVVAQYRAELPKFFKRYQVQPVWRALRVDPTLALKND